MARKHVPHLGFLHPFFKHVPAIPYQIEEMVETALRLLNREEQTQQAKHGLTHTFTLGGYTATAYQLMYGKTAPDGGPLPRETPAARVKKLRQDLVAKLQSGDHDVADLLKTLFEDAEEAVGAKLAPSPIALSLDDPKQWAMSWTAFPEAWELGQPHLETWAATLTDVETANRLFWPTMAEYGLSYNLLIAEKVDDSRVGALRKTFGDFWTDDLEAAYRGGTLFVIDFSMFEKLEPRTAQGHVRFTPATVTLLTQDSEKNLTPVAVRVAGHKGHGAQVYTLANATDSTWLYALQAAKVSATLYGIWLGHVYHWHIVTAAMQMTFYNNLPEDSPLYELLAPHSKYVIPFDADLLLAWSSGPPTSITSPLQFVRLLNDYADGREYFDDDPKTTLEKNGIREADFTVEKPWDKYPIVGQMLQLWQLTEDFVRAFVDHTYADDPAVTHDAALQAWMEAAADPKQGNLRGLPPMESRAALVRVLTSLLYRVTVHGTGRLNRVVNPALTFVANFPACLHDSTIPEPSLEFDTKTLLAYLPNTETIGEMATFYFTFAYSPPYEPMIPMTGIDADLYFADGDPSDPRNVALVRFRQAILDFVTEIEPDALQRFQWPANVEI